MQKHHLRPRHGGTCAAQDSSSLAPPGTESNKAADHHTGWAVCAPCPPAWQQAVAGTQEFMQLCADNAAARTDTARATLHKDVRPDQCTERCKSSHFMTVQEEQHGQ